MQLNNLTKKYHGVKMFKFTLKAMAAILIFAVLGCGRQEEPAGETYETEYEATEISDEALIDIMAHSSYLSMALQEDYQEDPEAATEEFENTMSKVAQSHGVTLEELQDESYEAQWNELIQDPEFQQRFQQRIEELQ